MGESKFADAGESKFADDSESKQGESKFADDEVTETAIVAATTVFGDDPIIAKLVDFWSQSLAADINTFFVDNCHMFEVEEAEHKMAYTKLHAKYEKIMEGHLQEFRSQEGITEKEMYARIRKSTDANELAQMIIELVLSCVEFESFVDIMKAKQRQLIVEERGLVEAKC